MKSTKITRSLILILCIFSTTAGAQKINTDAIDAFWRVLDRLKADQPLTDSIWNAYYNLPGNRIYIRNNLGDWAAAVHRGYLELVFRPSYADSLNKVVTAKTEDQQEFLFQNLWYIKGHENALRQYVSEITAPGYIPLALDLAKKYLPENRCNPLPSSLSIYLEAVASDAAVQDSSMYFGLGMVYSYDRYRKTAIAAHEVSHLLRREKLITGKLSPADSAVFTVIDEINNEGCADLIDKTVLEAHADSIIRGKLGIQKFLGSATGTIRALDSALGSGGQGGTVAGDRFAKILRYSSGHIPGYYMVRIIRRNGLVSDLITSCDNPFNFFYLYQRAALADKERPPLFSRKTMAVLKELEKSMYN